MHVPECPTVIQAVALGRRWAYEDIVKLKLHSTYVPIRHQRVLDAQELRMKRILLRQYLIVMKRLKTKE